MQYQIVRETSFVDEVSFAFVRTFCLIPLPAVLVFISRVTGNYERSEVFNCGEVSSRGLVLGYDAA